MLEYKAKCVFTVPTKSSGNGFSVIKCKAVEAYSDLPKGMQFTCAGFNLPSPSEAILVMDGEWETNKYGRSFKVTNYSVEAPRDEYGFCSYISSLRCGIGSKTSGLIYNIYGESSWDVVLNTPEELLKIKGVTEKNLEKLKNKIEETQLVHSILKEFNCPLINAEAAGRIARHYGNDALKIIRANPYALCDVGGFAFEDVDSFAKTMPGWSPTCEERMLAGVQHMFKLGAKSGHVCVPKEDATKKVAEILKVDIAMAKKGLNVAYRRGSCVVRGDFAYAADNYICERDLAADVLRIMRQNAALKIERDKLDELIAEFEKENGFALADNQKDAVRGCFNTNINIITGGPGTGKSTIIKAIIFVIKHIKEDADITLMAPTGRASRRMTEATGYNASTIHSALGICFDGGDSERMIKKDPLNTDVIIVDETSMVDQFLARDLFSRVGEKTVVVLVGDSDQLPSVNAGNVLHELINSGVVPFTRLNVIFRQAAGNPIIINSKRILEGNTELMSANSFKMISSSNDEEIKAYACKFYERCVSAYGIDNVVMLIPTRQKGAICVNTLNKELAPRINPRHDGDNTMTVGGIEYHVGDKVMQLKNTDDGPKNGDIGYIRKIEMRKDPNAPFMAQQEFCDIEWEGIDHLVPYTKKDMFHVNLAFAQSIHKSQGSEYKVVIIVMTKEHRAMAKKNLLYTGVTRAKVNCALIGDADVFSYAIKNEQIDTRYTQLGKILSELHNEVPAGVNPKTYALSK